MESAIEVRQLRAFVALVEQGTVTGAARALDLAQSTVSESLSSLERALGTPLLIRRRGSHELVLTDAGQALLPHARSVLNGIASARVDVARTTTDVRARLIIATNESLSSYVLAPTLHAMRSSWPNTTFAVTVTSCRDIGEGVATGAYDIGLTLVEIEGELSISLTDRSVIVNDVALAIFAQPTHPLATADSRVRRDALAPFSLFTTDPSGTYYDLVRQYLEADGLPGPRLQPTGSVESVKRGVLADANALGLLPAYAIADDMRIGRVVALDVHPHPPSLRVAAILSKVRPQHPASRELVELIRASSRVIARGTIDTSSRMSGSTRGS